MVVEKFWDAMRGVAKLVSDAPSWQKAGINLNEQHYETFGAEKQMTDNKIDVVPHLSNNIIEWHGSTYSSIPNTTGYKQGNQMILNLQCESRECSKTQTPYLDPINNTIHCSICDEEMVNLSPFMKNMLRQNKILKERPKKAFAIKCSCGKEDTPIISDDDQLVCPKCKQPHKLTPVYAQMLKSKIKGED